MAIPPFASAPGAIVGTTVLTGGVLGSVLYVGTGGVLAQENARLYYDDPGNRLSVGTNNTVPSGQTALVAGDYLLVGANTTSGGANKTTIIFTNNGYAAPSAANATSNGDKLVFYNLAGFKTAIGMSANADMFFQSNGSVSSGFYFYSSNTGTPGVVASINYQGLLTTASTTLHATSVALTNGAGASAGTLTNAPAVGNPTKWVPINDNGTTRYIPAW